MTFPSSSVIPVTIFFLACFFHSRPELSLFLEQEQRFSVVHITADKGPTIQDVKRSLVLHEFFELLAHFISAKDTVSLEFFANLDEESLTHLVGKDGETSRRLMLTNGTLLDSSSIFRVRRVLVLGSSEDVANTKDEIEKTLAGLCGHFPLQGWSGGQALT